MHKVCDVMKKSVLYLLPSDTIFDAAKLFAKFGIAGAPVVNSPHDKRIVGIVSEADIVKHIGMDCLRGQTIGGEAACTSTTLILLNCLHLGKEFLTQKKSLEKLRKIRIGDVMSKKLVHISPDEALINAAHTMDIHDVSRLPVVSSEGRLVGIIARRDIVKAMLA
jgi:CBS domain-containing protein